MRALVSAIGLLASMPAALALEIPQPAGGDPHVQVAPYVPAQSVLLVGAVGRSMVITFGQTETIVRVNFETPPNVDGKAIEAPWQGPSADQAKDAPLGNTLPLWTMRAGRSSMQVVTQKDGQNRTYFFQLIGLPPQLQQCGTDDCDDPRIAAGVTFLYPAEVKQAAAQKRQAAKQQVDQDAAEARLRTDIFYGARNWKYVAKGLPAMVHDLAPDEVSDNTQMTGFRYLGNRQVPSLYIVAADGSERQVTPAPDQDLLVVGEDAYHWRLRQGSEVVDLYNKGFDPVGANPWTGTTSPEVVRVVRASGAAPK